VFFWFGIGVIVLKLLFLLDAIDGIPFPLVWFSSHKLKVEHLGKMESIENELNMPIVNESMVIAKYEGGK